MSFHIEHSNLCNRYLLCVCVQVYEYGGEVHIQAKRRHQIPRIGVKALVRGLSSYMAAGILYPWDSTVSAPNCYSSSVLLFLTPQIYSKLSYKILYQDSSYCFWFPLSTFFSLWTGSPATNLSLSPSIPSCICSLWQLGYNSLYQELYFSLH